jgi:hypothetical protein
VAVKILIRVREILYRYTVTVNLPIRVQRIKARMACVPPSSSGKWSNKCCGSGTMCFGSGSDFWNSFGSGSGPKHLLWTHTNDVFKESLIYYLPVSYKCQNYQIILFDYLCYGLVPFRIRQKFPDLNKFPDLWGSLSTTQGIIILKLKPSWRWWPSRSSTWRRRRTR